MVEVWVRVRECITSITVLIEIEPQTYVGVCVCVYRGGDKVSQPDPGG